MDIQKNEKRHRSRGHDEPPRKKPVRKERPKAKPKIDTTAAPPVLSERDRKRHRQVWIQRIVIALVLCTILVGGVICLKIFLTPKTVNVSVPYTESAEMEAAQAKVPMPDIDLQLLTVNEYSRPGLSTGTINGVVVHYTANPGSTAQQNRDYFENLKDTHTTKVSSNFVIGLEGEIIQCIPTSEIAYASNSRNTDTVSIECCHPDETGKFTDATYDSLVQLTAFLCSKFNLTENDVIRHYDITGKDCPKYFVENEAAWETFRSDVGAVLAEYA